MKTLVSLVALLFLSVFFYSCSSDDHKITTVEFTTNQLTLVERSSKRIELKFSETPKPTDSFIITIVSNEASTGDYVLSESVTNNEFVLTGENPYFDLSAVFDATPEADKTIIFEITPENKNFKVGTNADISVILKNYNIGNNLVGEYLFNGNAEDSSPENLNHGTVFGASPSTDRRNTSNNAYSFDGVNDYIRIPDYAATDFNSSGDFSISLWIAPTAIQTDLSSTINHILQKWTGTIDQPYPYSISLLNSTHENNPNEFYIATYDVCTNGTNGYSGVINYNGFYHFVMVKSGNKLLQYLNGIKVSEVTSAITCQTSNNTNITIGCHGQLFRFFKGKIDDIRFYNVAISQNLVTELYEE